MLVDVEAEAVRLLERLGFDSARAPYVEAVAAAAVGAAHVVTTSRMFAPARYVPESDTIEVRASVGSMRRRWCLAHELGERALHLLAYQGEDSEQLADGFAAALLVPGPALRAELRRSGRHLPTLARLFAVSQTIVALRLGEVTGSPLALVSPRWVKVRGEDFAWPGEEELRAIASRREPPAGVERRALTDAAGRVLLTAA